MAASTRAAGAGAARAVSDAKAWTSAQQARARAPRASSRDSSLVVAYKAVAAGVAGIRRGLDVNAELQSAQLGIAALVAAQGGLTDAKGKRSASSRR
jgi:hypothetical protein